MKVLVACEESQAVATAFRERGHDAYSCDILPCSGGHPEYHLAGDVREFLDGEWDLICAFPPCTDIAVSGARYFSQKRADGRQQSGIDFFMLFANHSCKRIAIENPIGIMSSVWRKPDQIIQPWQFGHDASKSTCLWLKGLPLLVPTKIIDPTYACRCGHRFGYSLGKYGCPNCNGCFSAKAIYGNQTPSGQNKLGPSKERASLRSKTYRGIAEAMANQWGNREELK